MTTPLKFVLVGGNSGELREWGSGDSLPVALGGTGGTTAAAARSNLGLGAAAVAAILGTVSQSGGVPTGAIFFKAKRLTDSGYGNFAKMFT